MALNPIENISQAQAEDLQGFSNVVGTAWYASYVITASELTASKQRAKFLARPRELPREGTKRFGDKPYKLDTENGVAVIIPQKYVTALKSDRDLNFSQISGNDAYKLQLYSGFESIIGPGNIPPNYQQTVKQSAL
ncbi:hypothetical protein PspLS_09832 [Pyricularia sp. CBS 133598]|nr:hypothetical protein PspLS_09832 [Pyricularia sp. CBS 133598]